MTYTSELHNTTLRYTTALTNNTKHTPHRPVALVRTAALRVAQHSIGCHTVVPGRYGDRDSLDSQLHGLRVEGVHHVGVGIL